MYDEIKITGQVGDGSVAKELNKLSTKYEGFILLGFTEDEFYFLAKRKYGKNFSDLYDN